MATLNQNKDQYSIQNASATVSESLRVPSPPPKPLFNAHLRIARPSNNIPAILPFYTTGLGFSVLSSFTAHAGFDGVMLGHPSAPYHLEFTTKVGHDTGRAPTQDNLLVFYLPDEGEWKEAVARMERSGFRAVESFNPYWDVKGKTFEDRDGWRIVLQNAGWELQELHR
ncbi:Glyoxalase/Bleomycin resistance protein/Dihydroxybiphenyl dioxygenase [Glonium stellatum]|uniref:Glyoxalase/Bleomycin resistance protein/Dihydroxybiphenyl dioxygenase n=1 Tax=Glonium stellatum TaxID=574774 RepID=A0A8E2F626_9PEZI|nr:Glyoxalase/Bleomycin resistance protein/Dihydroxybiphenyl dioxygenase [Glonium stellatum]